MNSKDLSIKERRSTSAKSFDQIVCEEGAIKNQNGFVPDHDTRMERAVKPVDYGELKKAALQLSVFWVTFNELPRFAMKKESGFQNGRAFFPEEKMLRIKSLSQIRCRCDEPTDANRI